MGNSFGCSASGERLVSAARDGDFVEAKMLLDCNPCLAKYSTFGGLNSPLHFAAAKGHNEIVTLLLENGADVNSRNYCGQTSLMQACRYGHWEVVQSLVLFRCNVLRADYLSGRTALHFAAANGHASRTNALSKVVNKAADGGITALHMAALNGYFDCVQLLLDLKASVSAMTFHYGTSMDLIGAGSSPLHYAACGGNLKCCQILLARGSSRLSVNCNGCLPIDVARMWGRHWLEPLLEPSSELPVPMFMPSSYLSLPLMSVLNIARDCGLQFSRTTSEEVEICAVCLERTCSVAAEGCGHELCVKCALYLCSTSIVSTESSTTPGSVPCPLCRHGILYFVKLRSSSAEQDIRVPLSLTLCTSCMLHPREQEYNASKADAAASRDMRKTCTASVSSDIFCPVSCSPFPSAALPLCTCSEGPCPDLGSGGSNNGEETPSRPQSILSEEVNMERGIRPGKTTCSNMFWARRSSSRENQCKAEINA